jgi:carbonic anhydrase/acetyltransferase-like protein (isoleucine patch superfamily)
MEYDLEEKRSQIDRTKCWIAPSADLIGQVRIGENSSIWWQAVLRADNEPITIGTQTNIQDGCVLHTDPGFPLTIGNKVSVGHLCMLHGCTIDDGSLIGIGSIILNGAKIGRNTLIGANTLVTEGKQIPPNSLVVGSPGRVIRELTEDQVNGLSKNADGYVKRAEHYRKGLKLV